MSGLAQQKSLLIACGALAHELVEVLEANHWDHIEIQCLPADWHNTPDKIAPGVEKKILENQSHFNSIFVAYGDCGTGGHLDTVIERYGVARLPGAHCYEFFTGHQAFTELADEELGTFFLTDYLAWHFDRLILDTLGIKKHPELRDMYFGNYTRMLYLAQTKNEERLQQARDAAESINLPLDIRYTGLQPLQSALQTIRVVVE